MSLSDRQSPVGGNVDSLAAGDRHLHGARAGKDGGVWKGVAEGIGEGRLGTVCGRVGGRAEEEDSAGRVELHGSLTGQEGFDGEGCRGVGEETKGLA